MQTMPMAKSETRTEIIKEMPEQMICCSYSQEYHKQHRCANNHSRSQFHAKETFHLVLRWKGVQKSFLCFTNLLLKINNAPQQQRHFVTVYTWYFYCTCFSFTFYLSLQLSSNIFHKTASEAALGELRLGQLIQV